MIVMLFRRINGSVETMEKCGIKLFKKLKINRKEKKMNMRRISSIIKKIQQGAISFITCLYSRRCYEIFCKTRGRK